MTENRAQGRATPAPDSRDEVDPDVARLLGLRPVGSADVPAEDDVDAPPARTATAVDEGEPPGVPDAVDQAGDVQLEPLAMQELRDGETGNPDEAAEEGLTWIPPTDPPVIPAREAAGAAIAAGFGTTATDEPFDADHHGEVLPERDERTSRVEEALRADARTSPFADAISVETDGGTATLTGHVQGMEDEDAAVAVAEEVAGVTEVVSRLVVDTLEAGERA